MSDYASTTDNVSDKRSGWKSKSRFGALSIALILGSMVVTARPASAYQSLCGSYGDAPSFGCVSYSGFTGQQPWGYPVDANGHNCTNYVTFRLAQNGASSPGNLGNAYEWDDRAASYGIPVNGTPAIGSVAVWEVNHAPAMASGHVAYVEAVTSNYIDISEDNYGGTTMRKRFFVGQADWPDHFVHVKDVPTAPTVTNNLTFIKTVNPSGNVEVHWASEANNFAAWSGGVSTWFSTSNAANGTFRMYDMNGDGRQDLVYIKTQNTTNAKVELHWLDAADNFSGVPHSYATWFSTSDAPNGTFLLGKLDGHPDLVFIKTANTGSGKVELHYVSSVNNYSSWVGGTATWFSLADAGNGTFKLHDMNGVGGDDLVFIKTQNTSSGKVELHWLDASTGFTQPPASYATWYNLNDVPNGTFEVARLYGTNPGLVFIKKYNTSSGKIEVHFVSSANNYATWWNGDTSWFSVTDSANGVFTIGAN